MAHRGLLPFGRLVKESSPLSGSFRTIFSPRPLSLRSQNLPTKLNVRHASSTRETSATSRLVNFFYGTTLIFGLGIVYFYVTDTRASVHKWIAIPVLRYVYPDPEEAHHAGNRALKALWDIGLHPRERGDPDAAQDLAVEVLGHTLRNPIATSAGIDKGADIPDPLLAIGPAIIEVGGATPQPQPGNDKPRVFRLTSQNAMINRYGLNSEGADHVAMRLRQRVREFAHSLGLGHDAAAEKAVLDGAAGVPPGSLTAGKLLAVNIAKNKSTPGDDVQAVTDDYVYCVNRLAPYADILVVNVSSPNTPGLRTLQQSDTLKRILTGVVHAANSVDRKSKPAVMVKVSPDEDTDAQIAGICAAVWASGVDGIIVGNTTNQRPKPLPYLRDYSPVEEQHLLEHGGFSGPHLFNRTVALVKRYKALLEEQPEDIDGPQRSRSALEVEAEKLRASINQSEETKLQEPPIPGTVVETPKDSTVQEETQKAKAELEQQNTSERDRLQSILDVLDRLPAKDTFEQTTKPKAIFATGGITNGQQAAEVLDAGADVAMVYTALVYGGVGTISRIKDELRATKRT
ncbi:dihydroorotate dehydrogenase (fumarate) [Cyphellophora europaea CBS 101466]|uniref:Dihydroorotate dehydrogenase (quinone), mitochondrial n=1 Tax=Cyphellophora europaea (strain CBS 101466) TaxID=1220924 RepID=W2SE72_CYPE1|nr:dihydroorotate dehydrogenase (fumarate) [Cyphellophora europaea CBS 101466]ETN47026.1 dihydroorotate dehydrogenase (fumarate) [Cyphellophora europaea CBS 101466]